VADQYEPGDEVTMVGYTNGCVPNTAEDAVLRTQLLYGYLHETSVADDPSSGTKVGRFVVEDTPHRPRGFRMRLRFTLPDDIEPGDYYVMVCEDPCEPALVYGAPQPLFVGTTPPKGERPVRGWPLDDPAIASLDDDALLFGPGSESVTAAEVRETGAADRANAELDEDDVAIADDTAAADANDSAADSDEHEGRGSNHLGHTAIAVVIGVVGLAVWLALTRRGDGRKQVRQGPPRL
jgi:hypothetical protein